MKIWHWFINLMKSPWQNFFGTGQVESIKYDWELEIIVPKQLGAGNPSEDQLKSLAEDISQRETALDANFKEVQIEGIRSKTRIREREAEAKIANDKGLLDLRQKQLDLKAEEIRRTQDRLDEEMRAKLEREQFVTEQEQFRISNEQAATQAKEKQEQKAKNRAAKAERREQRWQAFKTGASQFWSGVMSKLWSGIKFLFRKLGELLGRKWVKMILAAAVLIGFGIWFFQTETGTQFVYSLLGSLELYQTYIAGTLGVMLIALVGYRLNKSGKWPTVKDFVLRKVVLIPTAIVGLLFLVIWLNKQNYFEGWWTAFVGFLWSYGTYVLVALALILIVVILRWIRQSQTRIDKFNDLMTRAQKAGSHFWESLSITTAGVWAIASVVLAIFGIYNHSWLVLLTALAWLPMCLGLRPGISLSLRVIFGVILQSAAITLGKVTFH